MSEHCFTARGLDSLDLILRHIPNRVSISYPNLICDEVVAKLGEYFHATSMHPYHIDHRLMIDWETVATSDVLYAVDYFGRETEAVRKWDGVLIHDAVWMPLPLREVGSREWWFNSARKYAWPLTGSVMVSQVKVEGGTDATAFGDALASAAPQKWARATNYDLLAEALDGYNVENFWPHYASVYPLIVPERDAVTAELASRKIQLPGMWKNTYNLPNDLYDSLMLVPCDGRFSKLDIGQRAKSVLEAIEHA